MKRLMFPLAVLAALAVAGCSPSKQESAETPASAPAPSGGGVAAVSAYDSGPRASESPADKAKAEIGEKLFQTKGCTACHGWGKRLSGPDLKGVTLRRTALWMENQILHPEVMTKQDPISHGLFAQFSLQMPNQGLTQDEARAVIEYLKQREHEDE